jgi:hypothetical protein
METKNILHRIFFDENKHWEAFVAKHNKNIRPVVHREVAKFRDCGNIKKGFKLLVCEGCHDLKVVPYRCKGRFCTTCSCGGTEEWSRVLAEDVFRVTHRHVILTIDEGLRDVFLRRRDLLKAFMDAGVGLIKKYFEEKHKITPGIIAGLHTFGSRLNFNPHIHMMVTMGGMKESGEWKNYDYIPFEMLRKQWQTVVLKLIRSMLSPEEKKKVQPLLQKAYLENKDGFYVYAPKQTGNVKAQLGYIGRYIRRPAIAVNRIEAYDGRMVTFRYHDKTDGVEKRETVTVEEFITRLIRHIPDEQFKTIRHYGVYARRIKGLCKKLVTAWQKEARKWIVKAKRVIKRKTWSEKIKEYTGKDPMVCLKCECYYEYKGEVCLQEGQLTIKYAACEAARASLERMIRNLTGIEETKASKEKESKPIPSKQAPRVQGDRQISVYDVLAERRHSA